MIPLAWKEGENEETYEAHINNMLNLWRGNFRNAYLPSLSRIIGSDKGYVNDLIEIMIILHDLGKLFIGYQKTLRKEERIISRAEYRHEIVSAALTFFVLPVSEELYVISGAILLHHEPILMGQVSRYAEPYLTITDVERRLRKSCGGVIEFNPDGIRWTREKLKEYSFNFSSNLPVEVEIDEILDKIKELMLMLCVKCSPERKATLRLKVSALGTLLSIIDSVAANRSRKLDDGGTFITRRAEKSEVSLLWL